MRREKPWWFSGLVGGVFGLAWTLMGFLIYGEVRLATGIPGWATWFAMSYFMRDSFGRR